MERKGTTPLGCVSLISVYCTVLYWSTYGGAATGLVCAWAVNSKSVPAWRRGSTSEVPLVTKSKVTFAIESLQVLLYCTVLRSTTEGKGLILAQSCFRLLRRKMLMGFSHAEPYDGRAQANTVRCRSRPRIFPSSQFDG